MVDDDHDEGPILEESAEVADFEPEVSQSLEAAGNATGDGSSDGALPEQATAAKGSVKCAICGEKAQDRWIGCGCEARTHLECLAQHYMQVLKLHRVLFHVMVILLPVVQH